MSDYEATGGRDRAIDRAAWERAMERLRQMPDVREELVARIKAEVQAGRYDTEEKVDDLLDGLLVELRSEQYLG